MSANTKQAVVTAIIANAFVTLCKFFAFSLSGSASMFNEAVHSVMDTANQALLYFGLLESERPADETYAFGHAQYRYIWNLGSAVGLFSIGAGVGLYHAWHSFQLMGEHQPVEMVTLFDFTFPPLWINLVVIAIAIVLEGYSLLVALGGFLHKMREDGESNPFRYLRESNDPTLVAIVLEDSLAVGGLFIAMIGILLSEVTGNPVYDIAFSGVIALLLGAVAVFLLVINARFLADKRDHKAEAAFIAVVDAHDEIERYHDLRSIMLDVDSTILVAEVEVREEAILPGMQELVERLTGEMMDRLPGSKKQDQKSVDYIRNRAIVEATLRRTERIIEDVVARVKANAPQISHCTLEIEGIATPPEKS